MEKVTQVHTCGNSWKAPIVSWFLSEEPPMTIKGLKTQTLFLKNASLKIDPADICSGPERAAHRWKKTAQPPGI